MTNITDILAMEPRYCSGNPIESNNIWADRKINAAKAIIGKKLVEALEALLDEQNGSPLIKHQHSWSKAVGLSKSALAEWNKLEGSK
jgi:hypothetical protein